MGIKTTIKNFVMFRKLRRDIVRISMHEDAVEFAKKIWRRQFSPYSEYPILQNVCNDLQTRANWSVSELTWLIHYCDLAADKFGRPQPLNHQ